MLATTEAQPLRLGERIPTIDVDSSVGSDLKLVEQKYTCIVFMHSESAPSLNAIRAYSAFASKHSERVALVLITAEQDGFEQDLLSSFATNETVVAFDNNFRTFKNFEVRHIPFAVIYETRSKKARWFGSLSQLDEASLCNIIK